SRAGATVRTARPGGHLLQVLAQGAGKSLRQRSRVGGGVGTVRPGRADPGSAGGEAGASLALVQAQPGGSIVGDGGVPVAECGGDVGNGASRFGQPAGQRGDGGEGRPGEIERGSARDEGSTGAKRRPWPPAATGIPGREKVVERPRDRGP